MSVVALDSEDLNDTDREILDILGEGRVTPQYVADRVGITRPYASDKLKRLLEHDAIMKVAPGLYELVDDPRADGAEDDVDETVADAIARQHELEMEVEDLEAALDDCRDELDSAAAVDVDQLRRALDDVEAAAEHGDANGLQDALRRAREAINDA